MPPPPGACILAVGRGLLSCCVCSPVCLQALQVFTSPPLAQAECRGARLPLQLLGLQVPLIRTSCGDAFSRSRFHVQPGVRVVPVQFASAAPQRLLAPQGRLCGVDAFGPACRGPGGGLGTVATSVCWAGTPPPSSATWPTGHPHQGPSCALPASGSLAQPSVEAHARDDVRADLP